MNAIIQKERFGLLATLGFVLSLPALLLFISGMLQSFSGIEVMLLPHALLHPAVILGGLALALVLNARATLRIRKEDSETGITISLDIARRKANLAVLGIGLFLLGAIFAYLFVENML
ncbi:MAG: hypothetical protein IH855_03360 [Bacteroidetes bacterium]|nr:hypothetical protein [Bacteroidota bacterium]